MKKRSKFFTWCHVNLQPFFCFYSLSPYLQVFSRNFFPRWSRYMKWKLKYLHIYSITCVKNSHAKEIKAYVNPHVPLPAYGWLVRSSILRYHNHIPSTIVMLFVITTPSLVYGEYLFSYEDWQLHHFHHLNIWLTSRLMCGSLGNERLRNHLKLFIKRCACV